MEKTKIIFLVLPHVHLLDLAGPDQVFFEAMGMGAPITIHYCSYDPSLSTSSHVGIAKLKMFSSIKISKGDYVIIPGAEVGFLISPVIPFEKEMKKWLTEGYDRGAHLCSICTGAFFLARLGLLDGKRCTTHWKRTTQLERKFPKVKVVEDILFTEDERVFTSAGVTAGIDMALHITGRLKDDFFSFKVARELVVYMRRQGSESQHTVFMNYRNHIHSGIHKVQDFLQENIHKRLSLVRLAEVACMSPRNFTRIFKKETGVTVNAYMSLVRKEYLLKMMANPDVTRKQMATLCGLKSARQVIRLLKTVPQ
ncbi:MAG: AraC family transcriptional regulator [Cyclobacteriaceae bacterium]|nr:AraC family transcriptional regulator [Cyclobacteriaceae bacterium]